MKIFVCIACESNVCTCTRKQGGKPFICPDGRNEVKWHEVKKSPLEETNMKDAEK